MKLASLVKIKYFCYLTYALMVINLLGYVSVGSMECVVVFALATFACKSCLTKNMCLCIFGGLFVSNILFGCSKVKEGLETHEAHHEEEEKKKVEADDAVAEAEKAAAEAEAAATDGDDEDEPEGMRNMRRKRKRAVREAFTTNRRAIRSYKT